MAPRSGLFSSSVGTKILIGITGFALFLYLLIHIAGNLLVFFGPAVFNQYAYVMEERNPVESLLDTSGKVIHQGERHRGDASHPRGHRPVNQRALARIGQAS